MSTSNLNDIQKELVRLADNMAAAASSFSQHSYDSFIYARDEFIDIVLKLPLQTKE